jgi:hypothetical protein
MFLCSSEPNVGARVPLPHALFWTPTPKNTFSVMSEEEEEGRRGRKGEKGGESRK